MKKPAALILTDTHLKLDNVDLVKGIWQQAINKCKELKVKKIFFGGDFFTSRNAQPLDVLQEGLEIVKIVKEAEIELIAISGNHDKTNLDSERSYLDMYESNCDVVKSYVCVQLPDNVRVHFVPYFKESGSYNKHLQNAFADIKSLSKEKYKHILITHIGITGVQNNDGTKVENNLKVSDFKIFDKVFIGHYHNQSQIGKNIFYIGSAYQANYGEDNQKGFTILFNDGSHEFIKSEFPEYIKLKVDVSDTKAVKLIQKRYANTDENVRIVFTGDETQMASLNKEKFNAIGIDVKFDKEVVRQDLSAVVESNTTFDRSNIQAAFEHFCSLNEYEDVKVGINYLKKLEV